MVESQPMTRPIIVTIVVAAFEVLAAIIWEPNIHFPNMLVVIAGVISLAAFFLAAGLGVVWELRTYWESRRKKTARLPPSAAATQSPPRLHLKCTKAHDCYATCKNQ